MLGVAVVAIVDGGGIDGSGAVNGRIPIVIFKFSPCVFAFENRKIISDYDRAYSEVKHLNIAYTVPVLRAANELICCV